MSDMHELHDELYRFLLEKHNLDPEFRFTTRITNRFKRLEQGYWFHGNDYYIAISFWTGTDWMNKTPNIYFCITDTECFLMISVFDSEIKQSFVERELKGKIADLEYHNGRYYKYFGNSGWQFEIIKEALDKFLKDDKLQIDIAVSRSMDLQNDENKIGPIPEKTFQKWINNIEKYRRTPRLGPIAVSFEDEASPPIPFKIQRLRISSFMGIEDCAIDGIPTNTKCIFLTGENGAGKSSILKAIGTALTADHKMLEKSDVHDNYRIEIKLSREINGRVEEKDVEFARTNRAVYNVEDLVGGYASYGPYRLMTNHSGDVDVRHDHYNDSLFSPTPVLYDIEKGIRTLTNLDEEEEKKRKDIISSAIRDMIPGFRRFIWSHENGSTKYVLGHADSEELLETSESQFDVSKLEGDSNVITVTYDKLASGAKNVISMIGDMIVRLSKQQPNVTDIAELQGVVLVDEIDIHLHPIFQKSIVQQLTDNFPLIQFVISTHSPIPLLGAPKETVVYRVERDNEMKLRIRRVDTYIDLINSNPNLLLTSPIFGFKNLFAAKYNDSDRINTADTFDEVQFREILIERLNRFLEQ